MTHGLHRRIHCIAIALALVVVQADSACGQYTDGDDDIDGLLVVGAVVGAAAVAGAVAAAPFYGPVIMAKDDYNMPGYFPEYPYQDDTVGYMMIDPWIPSRPFTWSLRARTEYADDFTGVNRAGGRLLYETTSRFGIDSEFNYWREAVAANQHTDFWTGDANVVFRFAQSQWLQMRTGFGVNWSSNDAGGDSGFNFTYQGDLYPAEPWVLSGEFDWGVIGEEDLTHVRVTAGLHWRSLEVFTGFDHFDIGLSRANTIVAGVRFWR